jgi:hypothetical protein
MERIISSSAARRLPRRAPLSVDPRKSIAVKRDVHEYRVEAGAVRFADAFRSAMIDPEGTFGLIRIKRPAERIGKDFELGERFQGCYSLEEALHRGFSHSWLGRLAARALALRPVRRAVAWIEDALMSDYAVIDQLILSPDASRGEIHTLRYCYLQGTPIAGSSTFYIEPRGLDRCVVRQILEYQEINCIALSIFQRFGLKMHDQVVHMQIQEAAARAGIAPPLGTIPEAYTRMDSGAPSSRIVPRPS